MEETLDQISPMLPMEFFSPSLVLKSADWNKSLKKNHLLPSFSKLLSERAHSKVFAGWNPKGLFFEVQVGKPFKECFFPEYRKGDSVELFIDTRDLKTAGFATRFCHHFVILPKPVDELNAIEVTKFRSDDNHELCDGSKIFVKSEFKGASYSMQIKLPKECLHGYDPTSFDRLGLSYRINHGGKEAQHFTLSSNTVHIENHPARWASMQMREK